MENLYITAYFMSFIALFVWIARPYTFHLIRRIIWLLSNKHLIKKLPDAIPPKEHLFKEVEIRAPSYFHDTITDALNDWYDKNEPVSQWNVWTKIFDPDFSTWQLTETARGNYTTAILSNQVNAINNSAHHLPNEDLIDPDGKEFLWKIDGLFEIPYGIKIPEHLRTQHHHIVAGTGHGKTQLLQSMILDDIGNDCTIIVIDSQGDLIHNITQLATLPEERVVLIDPTDLEYPLALNLFDVGMERINQYGPLDRERMQNSIIELYRFVMASLLGAELTQKQGTAFDYVIELMMYIPEANIHTLRHLFEPDGTRDYQDAIRQLSQTGQSFFRNEFNSKEFEATKKQILRRLYGILRNKTFERMFSHPKSKLDMFYEMNAGKVILINTAESLLRAEGTKIFGRFFIALILQAIQERQGGLPVYLYIDEADQYLDEKVIEILVRARKRNVGLIAAHQYLGQLQPSLHAAFAANTAIKFAGGVSSQDANTLAKQMSIDPGLITSQGKGHFAAHFKNYGTFTYRVEFGRMENQRKRTAPEMQALKEQMRQKYQVPIEELADTYSTSEEIPDDGW